MARTRPTPTKKAPNSTSTAGRENSRAHGNGQAPIHSHAHGVGPMSGDGFLENQDWFNGSLSTPKKAVDFFLEMQRQWLKTASMGSETLALELEDLQKAKDPVQFVAAQCALANHQMEVLAQQLAAVMQQIYDAQLLWIGQWDEKREEPPPSAAPSEQDQPALGMLGKVQDEWLTLTRNWMDSINTTTNASAR